MFGDELSKTINIQNLSYRPIDTINKYMLSIGIKVEYNRLTNFELNKLYESFLFELENIDEIDILVTKNWKLDEIVFHHTRTNNISKKTQDDTIPTAETCYIMFVLIFSKKLFQLRIV